jgi:hypothetical protein
MHIEHNGQHLARLTLSCTDSWPICDILFVALAAFSSSIAALQLHCIREGACREIRTALHASKS